MDRSWIGGARPRHRAKGEAYWGARSVPMDRTWLAGAPGEAWLADFHQQDRDVVAAADGVRGAHELAAPPIERAARSQQPHDLLL